MQHDFEDIEVKQNALKTLESELKRKRNPCMVGTGAMCDPYLPLEEELKLTRQSLELVLKHGFGVSLITKSVRVLRDLDLLSAINARTKAVVQITLTTFDDNLCSILEPNVSLTSERINALEILQKRGIPTVVWLCPILPFINDTAGNLNGILDACIITGVKGIMCFGFGVTLREGDREYFYGALDRHFPGLKQRYVQKFGNAYVCNSGNHNELMRIFNVRTVQHGIMNTPDKIFAYLNKFEEKGIMKQLTLFEE
jgi:DNA repair photolyase